jgi:hypothetical protein
MPMNKPILPMVMAAVVIFTAPAATAADWWQKGADWLESLGGGDNTASAPAAGEVADAFRQALRIGTRNVVQQLGSENGFYADPAVHIPLPQDLQRVKDALDSVGMGSLAGDLELKLNRAAEAATPRAQAIFINAIRGMTFTDVMDIYNGPEDAATRYFQQRMTPELEAEMRPVVADSLSRVGAVNAYDRAIDRYRELPFVPDVKADLTGYVVDRALDGVFHYLAREEAAIRREPARRTTELLRKVFGGE